jgi:hypothetical protein
MDIKEILSNIDSSVLTEESKDQICAVFDTVMTEKVEAGIEAAVSVKVETALLEQDEAHASQLSKLLEAIDEDHSAKLKKFVSKLDEDHTAKLEDVVKKYEDQLSKEAKALTESLQIDISNFLDLTLDDLLPKNMLAEAVANTKAAEKLAKIQELVSVDESFINEHVREALQDGKEQIESLRKDLNGVLKENVKLGAEKSKATSELVLERKCKSLPDGKRLFVEQTFRGKSSKYIEENFEVALQMFERREEEAIATEKVQIISESTEVDTPKEAVEILQESSAETTSHMSEYVSGLK